MAVVTAAFIVLQPILLAPPTAFAQRIGLQINPRPEPNLSVTTLGTPITQNFDALPASGSATWTNDSTLPGWYHARTGTGTTIVANNGSSNAGNLYSYGCTDTTAPCNVAPNATTDRALGSLGSGNAAIGNLYWGILLTNNTGSTITSLDVSYFGEQWRNSAAAAQTISFSYITGTSITGSLADFQAAGTNVAALDFTSPVTGGTAGALNGNLAANRVARASTISGLSLANGVSILLRWSDPDHTGADHGLAIDDFSVTPQGSAPVDNPPTVQSTTPADNATNIAANANISITFSEPVNATTSSFQISCATSGTHAFNLSGGTTTYTLDPTTDFTAGEVCTVTVVAAQVTDQDGTPDNMAADYVFDFTVANAAPTPIHTIQGSGATSPLEGQTVTTTGIVTLIKTGTNTGGTANSFFIQDPNADADPNTSEGILVFTNSVPTINVGDEVTVTGTVVEFFGMTEISPVTGVSIIDTGNTLPAPVTLTTTILDPTAPPTQPQLEKYEGMRMSAASLTTTAPNDNFYDVYTVITGVPRPLREPGIEISKPVPPDPTTGTPDCCIPRWDENPERLIVDTNARAGAPLNPYTSLVVFTNIAGPLDFSFNEYRLIPEATPTASANMSAVPVPTPTANEFMVGHFNVENFNNNATQRQKAALAIRDVMRLPHIIGMIEIFDLADLQALATEVNTISGTTYQAYLVEADGTSEDNDQDVGYLVDTARVQVNSVVQRNATETYTNPNNGQQELLNDRPPLVLDANVQPAGANLRVIVVVNHLRSFIDIDQDPGEGPRVRAKRKAQAESLAALLQEYQTNNPTTSIISVGDYNAYQFSDGYTDPIATIKGNPTPDDQIVVDASPDLVNPNFVNLVDELPASERYSFNFEGTLQALDHVLVNNVARARRTHFAIARNNADFPEVPASAFASNAARPERNSDHDMPVAYFVLAGQPSGSFIISEYRLRGPGPVLDEVASDEGETRFDMSAPPQPARTPESTPEANNEFIEFYNNSNTTITVSTVDGSEGWALVAQDGITRFVIPNGTVIPARGHFLAVNSVGYSLNGYPAGNNGQADTTATGDINYSLDIEDFFGIALFNTANPGNFSEATRLDAVGYSSAPALYREGAGFVADPAGAETTDNIDYSFFRDMRGSGLPKDTNDNAADFLPADTGGATTTIGTALGAPGPENLSSPVMNPNRPIAVGLLDTTRTASQSPNRVRKACAVAEECDPLRSSLGTMSIRRTVTNNTGANVTRLRFRIIDITTLPAIGTADMRVLTSTVVTATINDNAKCATDPTATSTSAPCDVTVQGTTLEEPPNQPSGGGWNSSLSVGTITLQTPLAPGASVNIQFLLGVQQGGGFRFIVNTEALP